MAVPVFIIVKVFIAYIIFASTTSMMLYYDKDKRCATSCGTIGLFFQRIGLCCMLLLAARHACNYISCSTRSREI